jgi:hypothetical protein
MFDFTASKSPIIFKGDEKCAYRDPAVYYKDGVFYLFFTFVDNCDGGPFLTVRESISHDLINWSEPQELTIRDKGLNFSSPGNVIFKDGYYYLILQTYCRENGEKYGNGRSRIYTMKSPDLINWDEPRLLKVKGDIPEAQMGRMIDPFIINDLCDRQKWWCLYKQNGVSMSYSYDLENWVYYGNTQSGENVCVIEKDREYVIFHSPENGIASMKTQDFVHFEPFGSLITLGQNSWDWARGRLTAGFVLDLTRDDNVGKYVMFFHASGPENEETMFDFNASIGFAWSDDLINWNYIK